MVGNGMKGRLAALVVAALALGAPMGAAAQIIVPGAPTAQDEALWAQVQGQGTTEAYRSYISTYPNGAFVAQARARLGQLQAGSTPVVTAPPTPAPATPPASTVPVVTPPPAPAPVTSSPLTPAPELPPAQSPAQAARAEALGAGGTATPADGAGAEAALNLTLEDKRAIQSRLTASGYDTRGVDGTFGSGTRRAIRDWQASRGHAVTGYLTAAQAAELRTGTPAPATPAPSAGGATAATEAALELTPTQKRIIQSRLNLLGHDTRGIDGTFGSGTRRAITAWQGANNLPATGYLTRADAEALMNAGTTPAGRPVVEAETAAQGELALNLTREDRVAVQQALVQAGHDTRGVDGTFGSGTRRAIRGWQTGRSEPATGYLTSAQFRALRGRAPAPVVPVVTPGRGATAENEAALGLDPIARTEVQSRLSALGYDPKGIDGRFGAGTRRAISAWQGDNGLAATGYLDAGQLARLRDQRRN